ncbi:MAG: extracellular solute-binding protein [Treponema sp.]|jgi:raffinose/stachyose/melibiose transport system substrate-binding protein|nr:extracellular solute-binding protein [Treponema sp.]
MKKRSSVLLTVLIAFLALAVLFVGCSKTAETTGTTAQVELRVLNYTDLTAANTAQGIQIIWEAFEAANPDIKIVREDLYNEAYHEKIAAYAAANQMPDVVYAWPAGRSSFLHNEHLLKDLSSLLQKDNLTGDYLPAVLDVSQQAAGYLAVLPMGLTSSHAMYVNLEVLDALGLKPATTYEELKAQVPILKAAGKQTVIMDNASDWVMQSCLFSMVAGRFGGAGWEQKILNGTAKFTDPEFVAALNFIKTIYDDGVIDRNISLSSGYGDGLGTFSTNQGAYFIDGDWRMGSFLTDSSTGQALISPDRQKNFQITVFPDIAGAKINKSTSVTMGTGYGIAASVPAGSAKEEAAWRLIKWLTGSTIAAYQVQTGATPTPANTKIDISTLTLEPLQVAMAQLGTQYSTPTCVFDAALDASIATVCNIGLQEIGLGSKAPSVVAQDIQRAYDAWKAGQ